MPTNEPTPIPEFDDEPGYEVIDKDHSDHFPQARRVRMGWWVRGMLLAMAGAFAGVFTIATWLNPYFADGSPRNMATHTQMGMPPCNMVTLTGKPCPACGMTTSFSLLAHGDVSASLRANWCGTLLAAYWFALIPWALVSAIRGRLMWVRSGEMLLMVSVVLFLGLTCLRWVAVILQ